MSAGPDELHLREFREASELITDPLEAFLEAAQTTAEVLQGQQKASTAPVFRNGSCRSRPGLGTAPHDCRKSMPGAGSYRQEHHAEATRDHLILCSTGTRLRCGAAPGLDHCEEARGKAGDSPKQSTPNHHRASKRDVWRKRKRPWFV